MFRGSFFTKIDDKGRFKLPSDFRRTLEDNWGADVFLTSVSGHSGLFYPLPVWEELERRLVALPSTDSGRRRFLERVNYYGQQLRLDGQGRLVVPAVLRDSAGLTGDVVVAGALDHLDIWSRDRITKKLAEDPFTDGDWQALTDRGI